MFYNIVLLSKGFKFFKKATLKSYKTSNILKSQSWGFLAKLNQTGWQQGFVMSLYCMVRYSNGLCYKSFTNVNHYSS
jgi:hypothetical protein